ncbi:MAG: shikimate kinase [Bacteroides sp.]|nr:shikimate kinase [Bacteroides sp.]MBD5307084.1 shikimate kinase [Bacteroides sp.]
MKPIFIIGYMASGKTTLGRALARHLNLQFIDLDFYIEQRYRKKIPEIFAEKGEAGFRRMEGAMLREVGEFEDVVISCGGGTPCFNDNMDYIKSRGLSVWLDTSRSRIIERLMIAAVRRPLLEGKSREELNDHINRHLAERYPYYSCADITIPGDRLESKAQIASTLSTLLPLLENK